MRNVVTLKDILPAPRNFNPARRVETMVISDTHLFARVARPARLLLALRTIKAKKIYINGDFLGLMEVEGTDTIFHLHDCLAVLYELEAIANEGTEVIFVPGNHDPIFRKYAGYYFFGMEIRLEDVHVTVTGKKILVVHGDLWDKISLNWPAVEKIGDWLYTSFSGLDERFDRWRKRRGKSTLSLLNIVKRICKWLIADFRKVLIEFAKKAGYDGVICGHIHYGELVTHTDGFFYGNSGCWVGPEDSSAVCEDENGVLELVYFDDNGLVESKYVSVPFFGAPRPVGEVVRQTFTRYGRGAWLHEDISDFPRVHRKRSRRVPLTHYRARFGARGVKAAQ
jgi:UDP-2,3-diacylglucosamine pyrophosphatase LpxH